MAKYRYKAYKEQEIINFERESSLSENIGLIPPNPNGKLWKQNPKFNTMHPLIRETVKAIWQKLEAKERRN